MSATGRTRPAPAPHPKAAATAASAKTTEPVTAWDDNSTALDRKGAKGPKQGP